VEAHIHELGGQATYVHLDVTSEEGWRRAVETAVNSYGGLDVLLNNASRTPQIWTVPVFMLMKSETPEGLP
jgi:NAD(P)-dependent dehydrogenase (short-subunit alcohol dehydrogenase family)